MSAQPECGEPSVSELVRENAKLKKIVKVLIDRVERSTDAQGNAFSLFQAAITLESTVRQRTAELQALNRRLSAEIDERRVVEDLLNIAKAEAESANAGKTEFLTAASHDLLQPLNVARLFLDAIAEQPLEAKVATMLDRVGRSLESAEGLLRALLEMSRLDAGAMHAELTDVAVDPLLRRLADEYGLAAEERGLRLRFVPTDACVRTDIRLLERVLRNLLGNALRYTERGGVLVGARSRASRLHIEVWDTGSGIPTADLRAIFKEFHRLPQPGDDDRAPGMGLGLAIVDRIARLIGATVDVRSRLGRGSVFGVAVPLATDRSSTVTRPAASVDRKTEPFTGRTVFIIDDDGATLDGMRTVLSGWGIDAVAAHSIDDALARSRGLRELPAAILADFHLHDGSSGFDAIDALRASFACYDIPAIVITADPSDATRRRAAERGFGYLNKPLRVERLRSLLAHMLAAA